MLTQLFEKYEVRSFTDGFLLGPSCPCFTIDTDTPNLLELVPRSILKKFVLRCWYEYGGRLVPISVSAEFADVGGRLHIFVDRKKCPILKDYKGDDLPHIFYHSRDNRLANRLLPSQLIDWSKTA